MRNLTLEGKIVIFKTITISKIVFQSFITTVPKHVVNEFDYEARGLENVDIPNRLIALQCSWIRRLYDNSFHEWKLIPVYVIEKSFGTSFKFH